jgi:hypothetical protein
LENDLIAKPARDGLDVIFASFLTNED